MNLSDGWRRLSLLRPGAIRRAEAAHASTLLARARVGDHPAFEAIVRAWYPSCRRRTSRLVGESLVDRVLVEAFADVWHGLVAIETPRQLQLCLAGAIAHHAARLAASPLDRTSFVDV